MKLDKRNITSTISYVKIFALLLFIYMLFGGYLSISLASKFQSPLLAVLGFFVFIVAPLVFNKPLRLKFLKQIKFTFDDEFVLLEIFNYKTEMLEKQHHFKYEDIQSCVLSSTSKKTSTLKLFFQDSTKFQCTFVNEEKIKEDTSEMDSNVSLAVFKEIYSFNKQILLNPPFYASKGGITALIILTGLFIAAIVMNIIYYSKFLPFTLIMGASLYLQIILRRKRDIELFEKLKKEL
ncbi:hypothetical protein PQ469_14385 [Mucilaginibacter sp. KACC 22773]|uniref:hypothetical protein n=1 Tax=Mucilaginibacter sp. KACC 22773 TaxID=3025671 RepID=UPI002367362C|nr:hypothetical protein [Mucilaginibacter sp. KACC 22773]WDF81196.1 hypothetical protein PQ469_14385 [Mucilaginibacter sp. KACC 22773]